MNNTELEKRQARAANETLVISHTEGGFRVYNPANITHLYMVTGIPDSPKCNCPDFETHQSDPTWRCKHILAVLNQLEKPKAATEPADNHDGQEGKGIPEAAAPAKKERKPRAKGHLQMLIKRSVSTDGFINSLSVEFSSSLDTSSEDDIKQQAEKVLRLQAEIVAGFLNKNGSGRANADGKTHLHEPERTTANPHANAQRQPNGASTEPATPLRGTNSQHENVETAVPAQLLNVAGMNTRGGWKLFINVQVNGKTAKLFGNKKELSEHVAAAGFPSVADHLNQGMALYLPCQVVTKPSPDGKYLNIEKVLPKGAGEQ